MSPRENVEMTLAAAPHGQAYRIKGISLMSEQRLRLMELGFKMGAVVSVLQRAPLQGLLKVKVKETRFALCRQEAAAILVEPALSLWQSTPVTI